MEVTAIVVTYNRKELLRECITAILNQAYKPNRIIIIDNASTDGTKEMITEISQQINSVVYERMEKNLGGAGGFYEGIKRAVQYGSDYIWIMDDDSIPEPECLLKICEFIKPSMSFVASAVIGSDGCPMNVPGIDYSLEANGYPYWYDCLKDGAVKIQTATFVSIVVNTKAVKKCGFPCKEYFIWGDDIEYTSRLTRYYGPAYFLGGSIVVHKRANSKNLSIHEEDNDNRLNNYYYKYRNNMLNIIMYGKEADKHKQAIRDICDAIKALRTKNGLKKCHIIIKGSISGRFRHKTIVERIKGQISSMRTE